MNTCDCASGKRKITESKMFKLLIIEDDEEIRELVVSILECEHEIFVTSSLDEAEDFWSANRGHIKVVLSDLCLPDAESTVARLNAWQADQPTFETIFVSGLSETAVCSDFGLTRGVNFLSKPFRVSELRAIVAQASARFEERLLSLPS
jgi:DNA-binding NtrC family response regulator